MGQSITVTVNGEKKSAEVEPRFSLCTSSGKDSG